MRSEHSSHPRQHGPQSAQPLLYLSTFFKSGIALLYGVPEKYYMRYYVTHKFLSDFTWWWAFNTELGYTIQKKSLYSHVILELPQNLFIFRRSAHLVRMARVTILTSGPFCVGARFGSARSPFGSATQPPRLCCLWPANSTADLFTAREKCTEWWSAALTAIGEQWRASLWNQVRLDPGILAAHYTLSFRETLHARPAGLSVL